LSRLVLCSLALASRVAVADVTVTRPPPLATEPGWCFARYLKEAGRPAPKPLPAALERPATFKLGGATLSFKVPATLAAALVGNDLVQVGSGSAGTSDAFPGWEATLQLRFQTRAELEARIQTIVSDFTGTTRAQIETRVASLSGRSVEELCAIVRRTPGHATTSDGRHHASPDTLELVHGYLFSIDGKPFSAVYRLPAPSIDHVSRWERVLESLHVER
jgi:hypothetical protein